MYRDLPDGLPPILTQDLKFSRDPVYDDATELRYATLTGDEQAQLSHACETLFARLGARDYAKVDFRADAEGRFKLLEFNPNPSWNRAALADDEDEANGYAYRDILGLIIETAQRRYAP